MVEIEQEWVSFNIGPRQRNHAGKKRDTCLLRQRSTPCRVHFSGRTGAGDFVTVGADPCQCLRHVGGSRREKPRGNQVIVERGGTFAWLPDDEPTLYLPDKDSSGATYILEAATIGSIPSGPQPEKSGENKTCSRTKRVKAQITANRVSDHDQTPKRTGYHSFLASRGESKASVQCVKPFSSAFG